MPIDRQKHFALSLLLLLTFFTGVAYTQQAPEEAESTKRMDGIPYEDFNPYGTAYNLVGTELITNGGFETGNFSGWTVSPTGNQGWYPWQVTAAGGGDSLSGILLSSPYAGTRSAWNGFCCNTNPNPEYIYQNVTIPANQNAVLTWADRIQSDLVTYCTPSNCGSNIYRVEVINPTTSAVLQTLYTFTAAGGARYNTGWVTHSANLSAYAGQTIRLRFSTNYTSLIGGHYNGPGRAEIDAVSLVTTPGVVYMRSSVGQPWGQSTNEAAMNAVFGVGNWHDLRFETAVAADVFSSSINLVFMEGGDFTANEMENFLNANQAVIESWVAAGGRLFLNSAPNEGNGMSYGFGSTQLVYPSFTGASTASAASGQASHPIFNTPFTPTGISFSGGYFSHASISCPTGCTSLIVSGGAQSVLMSKQFGSGIVLFGGMTTTNFHSPQPNATNLRQNILYFLRNAAVNLNSPPNAVADSYTTDEDTPLSIPATGVLTNDTDADNDSLSAAIVTPPSNAASFNLSADGSFNYTPSPDFNGVDSFTYRANDGEADSNIVTVTITVNPVNDEPTIANVPAFVTIDELAAYGFTASASDIENSPLVFSLSGAPAGASINPSTGAFSWTPTEAQGPNTYVFSVVVSDGSLTASSPINITVNEVNAAPSIANVPAAATIDELAPYGFTATASDPDIPVQALTFSIIGAPAGASIDGSSGAFLWTPAEDQGPGVYGFTVRVSDGVTSADASISLTVSEVNSAPALDPIANQSLDELTLLSVDANASDSDIPSNSLTYSLDSAPAGMSIDSSSGAISWTPGESAGPGDHPVTVRVTDNGSPSLYHTVSFSVHVNEVNSAPVLDPIPDKTTDELVLLSVDANASDADMPANLLSYSLDAAPTGMSIDGASGAISWTPSETDGPGDYPVTVRVTDDGSPSLSHTVSFSIHVNEVNVAPELAAIGNSTIDEQVPFGFNASATDADQPSNGLTFSLVGQPSGASISSGGAFSWTPSESQGPGSYTFTVRVSDDGDPSLYDEQEITIVVNEVNLPPVLNAISNQTGVWGNSFAFTASASDPDIPANSLAFSLIGAPAGAGIDPMSGVFAWVPSGGQIGSHTFVVRVTDNGSPSLHDEQSVTINVGRRPTQLVYTGDGSEQYSDQQALSAVLTDNGGGAMQGLPLANKNVAFAIGTQNVSDATDASGIAAADLILTQDPNPVYTVDSSFAGDAAYLAANDSDAFDIVQEDARTYYTGTLFVNTACATCGNGTATLSATVKDITAETSDGAYDMFAGDIRNARVTFVDRDTNTAIAGCSNLPVGLVDLSDSKVGTATCNWSVNIGTADSLDYTIGIIVNRYYNRNSSAENTVVTISKPIGTNFITGGGYLVNALSSGQYAGVLGLKTNFGFNVKYNNSGKNLQGRVNVIVRGTGGRVYQIKGNVMRTLSVRTVTNSPLVRAAVYTGKANITDITDPLNPIALGGNSSFQMELTDAGEPGSADTIGLTAWNDAGGVLFSSRWNGTRTIEQLLGGGNVVVR